MKLGMANVVRTSFRVAAAAAPVAPLLACCCRLAGSYAGSYFTRPPESSALIERTVLCEELSELFTDNLSAFGKHQEAL